MVGLMRRVPISQVLRSMFQIDARDVCQTVQSLTSASCGLFFIQGGSLVTLEMEITFFFQQQRN